MNLRELLGLPPLPETKIELKCLRCKKYTDKYSKSERVCDKCIKKYGHKGYEQYEWTEQKQQEYIRSIQEEYEEDSN